MMIYEFFWKYFDFVFFHCGQTMAFELSYRPPYG